MVKRAIVLRYIILNQGIEVDNAKVDLIANLVPPIYVKDISSFLGDEDFYERFIKDFSNIIKPFSSLLAEDMSFHLSKECEVAFIKLNEALTSAPILYPSIWAKGRNAWYH